MGCQTETVNKRLFINKFFFFLQKIDYRGVTLEKESSGIEKKSEFSAERKATIIRCTRLRETMQVEWPPMVLHDTP